MGRPLSPQLRRHVVACLLRALAEGPDRRWACRIAGVSRTSFYAWLSRWAALERDVRRAEASAEFKATAILMSARDWRAALAWLHNRSPDDCGAVGDLDDTVRGARWQSRPRRRR